MLRAKIASLCLIALGFGLASPAQAQNCPSRGTLDARYCDADGDLLADIPSDKARQKDPDTLIFSYTPVEDPSVYENVFADFLAHLTKVTGKKIKWFGAESMRRRSRRCVRAASISPASPAGRRPSLSTSPASGRSWQWRSTTIRSATRCN